VTVTVNAKQTSTGGGTKYIWYSTNGGSSYTRIATALTTGGSSVGSINVSAGTSIIFLGSDISNTNNFATAGSTGTYPSAPGSCQSYTLGSASTVTVFLTVNSSVSGC
jgi:hypothetical protein